MITLNSATQAALNSDAFEYAYICQLPGNLYFTNHGSDLVVDGQTYISTHFLTSFDDVSAGSELNLSSYNLTLSNVDRTVSDAYVNSNFRGVAAVVSMVFMVDSVLTGDALIVYKGTLDSFGIEESRSTSELSLQLTSHWASYNQKNGRYTSDKLQQDLYPGDDIFKYANKEASSIGWGKR